MKRVGAVIAAVAMVVGALIVRGVLGGNDGDGDTAGVDLPAGLICAEELAEICADAGEVAARTARAGPTADVLIGAKDIEALEGEAWLVTSAWALLVIDERARLGQDPLFEVVGEPLASTGVAVAVWSSRYDQLVERCGETPGTDLGWRCLAEESGQTLADGDRVRVAGPDVDSASGLVIAASQAAGLLGRSDFASNDFDEPDFRTLAARLAQGQTSDPLRRMRTEGPGQITAAGTLLAGATNLATNFGTIFPNVPEPGVRADVVLLAPRGTDIGDGRRAGLTDALERAGWTEAVDGPAALPAGGVLAAIRTLWTQNR